MISEYNKFELINKAISEDKQLIDLSNLKQRLLNQMKPTYVFNKQKNTVSGSFDQETIEKINSINLIADQRLEEIKRHYN